MPSVLDSPTKPILSRFAKPNIPPKWNQRNEGRQEENEALMRQRDKALQSLWQELAQHSEETVDFLKKASSQKRKILQAHTGKRGTEKDETLQKRLFKVIRILKSKQSSIDKKAKELETLKLTPKALAKLIRRLSVRATISDTSKKSMQQHYQAWQQALANIVEANKKLVDMFIDRKLWRQAEEIIARHQLGDDYKNTLYISLWASARNCREHDNGKGQQVTFAHYALDAMAKITLSFLQECMDIETGTTRYMRRKIEETYQKLSNEDIIGRVHAPTLQETKKDYPEWDLRYQWLHHAIENFYYFKSGTSWQVLARDEKLNLEDFPDSDEITGLDRLMGKEVVIRINCAKRVLAIRERAVLERHLQGEAHADIARAEQRKDGTDPVSRARIGQLLASGLEKLQTAMISGLVVKKNARGMLTACHSLEGLTARAVHRELFTHHTPSREL